MQWSRTVIKVCLAFYCRTASDWGSPDFGMHYHLERAAAASWIVVEQVNWS